jgi:hypothetical protein
VTWSKVGDGGSFGSATSPTDAYGIATVVFTTDNTATIVYQFTATDAAGRTGTSGNVLSVLGETYNLSVSLDEPAENRWARVE